MLSNHDLEHYLNSFELSEVAKQYIRATRNSEPSRNVGTHAKTNVCSAVYSEKMDKTISTESRSAERSFLFLCEYDDDVIEIWDQPQPVKIRITNKNGKYQKVMYSPDFLVLTKNGPAVYEAKTEGSVVQLVKDKPNDWVSFHEDEYRFISAEEVFKVLGISHHVFVAQTRYRTRVLNIELLLQSRSLPKSDLSILNKLKPITESHSFLTLRECKERLGLDSYTPLIQWIDEGELFIDVDNSLLSEPESTYITSSAELLPHLMELTNQSKVMASDALEEDFVFKLPSQKNVRKALKRLAAVESGDKSRSISRWKKQLSDFKKSGLSDLQILCMNDDKKGNRNPKIPAIVEECLVEFITTVFSQRQGQSIRSGYTEYRLFVQNRHPLLEPVTYQTFNTRFKQICGSEFAYHRGGKRAANAVAPPTDPAKRQIKTIIPWQSAALDHYKADIYLVFSTVDGIAYVERPWITAMIDMATGEILAISISFQDPSRVACAKVMRDCVRRHGKLPREIIVDRGSDFTSVYFKSLLAHYGITHTLRPSSHCRYGAEIERFFGEFKQKLLCNRPGNVADYKEARSVDGKKAPKNSAVLSPADLHNELNVYLKWRASTIKPGSTKSRGEIFESKSKEYDFAPVHVEFDNAFLLSTSIESRKYKIDFQRGIHIGDFHYYCPKLQVYKGRKADVEVRQDPENPFVVYAHIEGNWELCTTEKAIRYTKLNLAQQIEQGLILNECKSLRRQLKDKSDLALAKLINEHVLTGEISESSEQRITSVSGEYKPPSEIDITQISDLDVEDW